jgi:hypothetical protein
MNSIGEIIGLSIAATPSFVTVAAAFCSTFMKVSHVAIATKSTLNAAPPAMILVMRYLAMYELLHREHADKYCATCRHFSHAAPRHV